MFYLLYDALHERSIEQVVKTLLHTLFYGTAVFLNLELRCGARQQVSVFLKIAS